MKSKKHLNHVFQVFSGLFLLFFYHCGQGFELVASDQFITGSSDSMPEPEDPFTQILVSSSANRSQATPLHATARITAPLVRSAENPIYFKDGNGRTIRLGGHQIHVDLQDHTFNKPTTYNNAETLDWHWYLDFAKNHNFNVLRNWTLWSTGRGDINASTGDIIRATPMMYKRTGPGLAADGLAKFDLGQFNQDFFDRMRSRASSAQNDGIYVIIMLFEAYGFMGRNFAGNVFNKNNNINGINIDKNGDGNGTEFFYTRNSKIIAYQEAYVRKVIETVGDLNNVVFEIANEVHGLKMQRRIIQLIRDIEATRDKQHLIYMSPGGQSVNATWKPMTLKDLLKSDSDIIGVMSSFGSYETNPPVNTHGLPVIWDNDHIWGKDSFTDIDGKSSDVWQHRGRAWMSFTRGYHFIYYDHPFERPEETRPADEIMRNNIGATNRYAEKFKDLAKTVPRNDLCSSQYCLANPGVDYLIYSPKKQSVTVKVDVGTYNVEWYDTLTNTTIPDGTVTSSGGTKFLSPPAGVKEDYALYLSK